MALTSKQEMYSIEVVKQDTLSAAYRIAYDASGMSDEAVNVEASKLMKDPKIALRVKELRKEVEKKELYTIEKSVKRDLRNIERYEAALDVLENDTSTDKEIAVAERTIKHIGANGYNSAQERLSKQHGFFKIDNNQKAIQPRQVIDKSDYNKNK